MLEHQEYTANESDTSESQNPNFSESCFLVRILDMSGTCPGHVLGTGTCLEIPLTELDGRPNFLQNLVNHMSVACPQSKSLVRYSKKQRKRELKSTNLLNLRLDD